MTQATLPIQTISRSEAFNRGRDCGMNGADEHNCHFSVFSSPQNTRAWELGKAAGESKKQTPKETP